MSAGTTRLSPGDVLPLTCTRSGTCCHGKDIPITPWELAVLAEAKGVAAARFRDTLTRDGGTRLACEGPPGWRGQRACSLYDPAAGCSVHAARPMACRLYPLGREMAGGRERFFHEGRSFPCLDGCPGVRDLPAMTVADYLAQQGVAPLAVVRDDYLDVAQDLAEAAFVIVFDSGLDRVDASGWKAAWRRTARGGSGIWVAALGADWHDRVTAPMLGCDLADGRAWCRAHRDAMQSGAQAAFASLREPPALAAASACMLAGALLLIHGLGGDAADVGRRWLRRAGI